MLNEQIVSQREKCNIVKAGQRCKQLAGLHSPKIGELCIYVDMFFIFCRHTIREHATADQGVRASDRLHAHVFSLPPLHGVQNVH